MVKIFTRLFGAVLIVWPLGSALHAAEEPLDLETETAAVAPQTSTSEALVKLQKFSIMGRIDLTAEFGENQPTYENNEHNLSNKHFLVFLKVKASEKTSFMGEIVGETFYYADYAPSPIAHLQFGKILVPFGDTRRFHHIYGGLQGYANSYSGVMFPNVWAAPGVNISWNWAPLVLDTYVVNSVIAEGTATDPDLKTTNERRQASGLRLTSPLGQGVTGILSVYSGRYRVGKSLLIGGFDFYTDYGALDFSGLKNLRLAVGFANATFEESPTSGTFDQRGDYLEMATNVLPGEWRARYGTFTPNNKKKSSSDTRSASLGYTFTVDVIRVLVEHQWNYEAVNERKNDIYRLMASLDF